MNLDIRCLNLTVRRNVACAKAVPLDHMPACECDAMAFAVVPGWGGPVVKRVYKAEVAIVAKNGTWLGQPLMSILVNGTWKRLPCPLVRGDIAEYPADGTLYLEQV